MAKKKEREIHVVSLGDGEYAITPITQDNGRVKAVLFEDGKGTGKIRESVPGRRKGYIIPEGELMRAELAIEFKNKRSLMVLIDALRDVEKMFDEGGK